MGRIWAAHGPHGFDPVCVLAGQGVAGKSTTLDQVFEKAPLIGQLSNRDLLIMIEELLTGDNTTAPVCGATSCRCGCGLSVAAGRKFVNQEHYDRSRTLHRDRAQELVNGCRQGVSKQQLAKEFGISYSAVRRLLEKDCKVMLRDLRH